MLLLEFGVTAAYFMSLAGYNEGSEGDQGKMKRLTALRWVAKCCPNVPHSLINKLFRLRQVCQLGDFSSFSSCPKSIFRILRLGSVNSERVYAKESDEVHRRSLNNHLERPRKKTTVEVYLEIVSCVVLAARGEAFIYYQCLIVK